MTTVEKRAVEACKKYKFMDEYFVEDIFGVFSKLKEVDFCSAKKALKDFGLDNDEVKGLVRLWVETDKDYEPVENEAKKVFINKEGFSFMVISHKASSWAKGDTIQEAKDALDDTIGYFYDYEVEPYQLWLVNEHTTIDQAGGLTYPREATAPIRIK